MDCVVICKLRQRQVESIVVLLIVDGARQILLKNLIDPLSLALSLKVKGKKKIDVNLKDLEECLLKP